MARSNIQKRKIQPMIQRYGLALLSVGIALESALFLASHKFQGVDFPLFLFAMALIAWYQGTGPAVLALVLSTVAFNYYFTEPLHTLYVTRSEIPYYVMFALFGSLVTWFSAVRRRVELALLRARDELQAEVIERTQQASLLDLTHDTIFVRDMSNSITYWNRGAQELYGWTPEQAIGKRSYDLLATVFR
jgi:PAS domain-containing protein